MMWKTLPRSELTQQLHGWRGGVGPALLLIHGVGMQADFWSHLVPDLVDRFSVTAIDLPGHGYSPRLAAEAASLTDYSDAVARYLSAQGEPSLVVGHSMGALIALDLAVRHADSVSGIGVLNAVYRRSREALNAIHARVGQLSGMSRPDSVSTLERWFGDNPQGIDRQACEACRRWLHLADQAGYADAYRAFALGDAPADESLARIRVPALFVTGALEPNSTPAMSMAMSEKVPGAHCTIVADARHMLPMTHAQELLSALIDGFGTTSSTHV